MTKSLGIASLLASPPFGMIGLDKFYIESYVFGAVQLVIFLATVGIFLTRQVSRNTWYLLIPLIISLVLSLFAVITLNLKQFANKQTVLYPTIVDWNTESNTLDTISSVTSIVLTFIVVAFVSIYIHKVLEINI